MRWGTQIYSSFELIGEGLQYRVYRITNGRVLKEPRSAAQVCSTLIKWRAPYSLGTWGRVLQETAIVMARRRFSIAGLSRMGEYRLGPLTGNPQFLPGTSYTQDFAQALLQPILRSTMSEFRLLVDAYIENLLGCWRLGFSDIVFNFAINSGTGRDDSVILLDLGEVSFSEPAILRAVSDKLWLRKKSFLLLPSDEHRALLSKRMDEGVTALTLRQVWRA